MSSLLQQALLLSSRTPIKQFQRFRGKINIQRPKKPHYERAKVIWATQPIYPEPEKTRSCFKPSEQRLNKQIYNPYNDIIAREVRNWLDNSRMVAIFHVNSIKQDEMFRIRVQLHKHNMHLKAYGRNIIKKAVENSRFEAIIPLFESNHCIVFSSEQNVAQLLRIIRKEPQLLLLAAIVDDTLLSRNELLAYAQLPGLQAAQAEVVQTLNMAAGNLVQQLETHQKNFVNVLDVHAKGDSSKTGDEAADSKQQT